MSSWVFYVLMIVSAAITAFSQILLKESANIKYKSIIFEYLNPLVAISYILYIGVLILNMFIYTKVDYRFGIVINSMSTVFVMLLSNLILKEKITQRRVIGNIMIVCSVLVFVLF